ncbi:phosphotransferase family protein [Halobaculum gomorrense]|uniref:Phosphotransferase enzyme family protein n=1 Tax=Halobaculum gomorrense TaxID=43928 RepID=A0A1M5JJN8_9EURY|nr:phosphotransferase [Halobaculum gomorrense]SHG40806.1 Phosphotransferase enzyme family protein [Halobaculum gomorrense]
MTGIDPRAAVNRAFPDRNVASVSPVRRGNRKTTTVVEFAADPSVVVQTASDIDALRSEAAVTMLLDDATSIPVATVIAGGVAGGDAYMITERVRGDDLHERFAGLDPGRRREVARAFGRYLGEVHAAATFERFGDVAPSGEEWAADEWPTEAQSSTLAVREHTEPVAWLRRYGRAALDRLPPAFDAVAARIRRRLDEATADAVANAAGRDSEPVLFPWDLRPGNALVDEDGVAAVLDWESPMAAPAALAVAKAEYLVVDWYLDDPSAERAAFRAGYEAVRRYPELDSLSRALAIADTAVDSTGAVTNPRYPELGREAAVRFHRDALARTV